MAKNPDSLQDLESPDNLSHNRWERFLERTGWCIGGALLLAAVVGWLGPGPLSHERAVSADDSIAMDYYSIERYSAPGKLRIWVRPKERSSDSIRVSISRSFTDHVTPEAIVPKPVSVEASGESLMYTFRAADVDDRGAITFRYKHDSYGSIAYAVGAEGHEPLYASQFVLP